MEKKKIAILVSCHKRFKVVSNEIIKPVQVGTSLAKEQFEEMLHDNAGDNISDKNKRYCELTAQYWAWKNLDADYYGFMHYRRYFNFGCKKIVKPPFFDAKIKTINENTTKKLGLSVENIQKATEKYDLLVPQKSLIPFGNYNQYISAEDHFKKDLDFCLDVIKNDWPEMYETAKKYMKKRSGYLTNMFIMKKEIFNIYNQWLFDILFKHEKAMPCLDYNVSAYRVSGYLAERLCGIYITWLKSKKNLKIKTLQRIKIQNTSI